MTGARMILSLVADRALRRELFDWLGEQLDLVPGFTASDVDGHGPTVGLHSAAEQVQGHAHRVMVRIILDESAATKLIDRLKNDFAGSRLVYWASPVIDFGVID
jgi:hypothetical protein